MQYGTIVEGTFLSRPNRFIAFVEIDGKKEKVHVKNTGRCRELLTPGACVYLEQSDNPARTTAYDLVVVKKKNRLVNMDSQAPNRAVYEWLKNGGLVEEPTLVRPETVFGNSRFDFYIEKGEQKIFLEVKGVTLENDNIVSFPDAPSDRAVKHLKELELAHAMGYRTVVLFVVQMSDVLCFMPAYNLHREFAECLCEVARGGVEVLAMDCEVTKQTMVIRNKVPVILEEVKDSLEDVHQLLRIGTVSDISMPLLEWYDNVKRELPWREDPSPYRVWVSEIMLQQTRVEAVKPYFERFMKELPNIKALADAEEEQLLKLWEGLGYYNRVRNLNKAAIQIESRFAGRMPENYEDILSLPGIGSYTAGAISSIAFGKKKPAVDGNVLRVLSRLQCDERKITDSKVKTQVEAEMETFMPADRPGDFNQAMMEIGACVCIPNGAPLCGQCPLSFMCKAHILHREQEFPKKDSKKARTIEKKTILILQDGEKIALRKRPDKGLLAGLYEFPSMEGYKTAEEVKQYLSERGVLPIRITPVEDSTHIFTHKEWHMKAYVVRVDELAKYGLDTKYDWLYVEPEQTVDRFPIPSAFHAYIKYLRKDKGEK